MSAAQVDAGPEEVLTAGGGGTGGVDTGGAGGGIAGALEEVEFDADATGCPGVAEALSADAAAHGIADALLAGVVVLDGEGDSVGEESSRTVGGKGVESRLVDEAGAEDVDGYALGGEGARASPSWSSVRRRRLSGEIEGGELKAGWGESKLL